LEPYCMNLLEMCRRQSTCTDQAQCSFASRSDATVYLIEINCQFGMGRLQFVEFLGNGLVVRCPLVSQTPDVSAQEYRALGTAR
jgi:hypothetical protein